MKKKLILYKVPIFLNWDPNTEEGAVRRNYVTENFSSRNSYISAIINLMKTSTKDNDLHDFSLTNFVSLSINNDPTFNKHATRKFYLDNNSALKANTSETSVALNPTSYDQVTPNKYVFVNFLATSV